MTFIVRSNKDINLYLKISSKTYKWVSRFEANEYLSESYAETQAAIYSGIVIPVSKYRLMS